MIYPRILMPRDLLHLVLETLVNSREPLVSAYEATGHTVTASCTCSHGHCNILALGPRLSGRR